MTFSMHIEPGQMIIQLFLRPGQMLGSGTIANISKIAQNDLINCSLVELDGE
jgi:hypothetical protein